MQNKEAETSRRIYHELDLLNTAIKGDEMYYPPAVAEVERTLANLEEHIEHMGGVLLSPFEEIETIQKLHALYLATGNKRALAIADYLEEHKKESP